MKIFCVIITCLIITQSVWAQTKTLLELKTDSIGYKVIQYLRDHQADSIYIITGRKFKENISAENFKSVSENQIFPVNDFKNVSFIKMTNHINKYKINGTPDLQLLIGLDSENKIETLLIQPYKED